MENKTKCAMIAPLLNVGESSAISTLSLMTMTGLDERALRAQIKSEREQGYIILSRKGNGGGYWLSASPEEASKFVNWMSKEARAIFMATRGVRKCAREVSGQISLEDANVI